MVILLSLFLYFMDFKIYEELTKTYILQRITQEQIMERYLNITVQTRDLFCAPPILRKDNNPTCSFYYNQHGKLRLRDFSGYFWGDCFDVVAKIIRVDASNKLGFQMVLHTIAKDFRIHKYTDINEVNKYNNIISNFYKRKTKKPKLVIKVVPRKINYHDIDYWKQFNISERLLSIGKVYFAQEIYLSYNRLDYSLVYKYDPKDPAYCYFGGKDKEGVDNWKIYYPYRPHPKKKGDRPRFHSNSSFLQGKHLITCGRIGIITKAYKDALSFASFGLQAVAPSAESVLISKDDYWFMKTKFDYLVSCMDYDRAGKRMAVQLYRTYGIPPLMFTNGYFNTVNYEVKDFAEYVSKKGISNTINLLTNIYDKYKYDFDNLDTYYYNVLKHIK